MILHTDSCQSNVSCLTLLRLVTVDLATGAGVFQYDAEPVHYEFVERLRETLAGFASLGEWFSVGVILLMVDMRRAKTRRVIRTIVAHTDTRRSMRPPTLLADPFAGTRYVLLWEAHTASVA